MGSKSQGGAQPLQATTVPGVTDGYYSNPPATREAQPDAQNMLARLAGQLAAGYGAGGPGYEGTSQAQFAAQMEPYYQPVDIPDYRTTNAGGSSGNGNLPGPIMDQNQFSYTMGIRRNDPSLVNQYLEYLNQQGTAGDRVVPRDDSGHPGNPTGGLLRMGLVR